MKRQTLHLFALSVLLSAASTRAAAVLYVNLNSPSPTPPYTDWSTAATNIQDAVDAASPGDQILVTNGVYKTGGRVVFGLLTNRVAVTKPLTLQSVNGPAVTLIQGRQVSGTTNGDAAVRCVYLTNNCTLIGFTLTNGATRTTGTSDHETCGGAVYCESNSIGPASFTMLVSNCVFIANSCQSFGGGIIGGTLIGCSLTRNQAYSGGGAMYSSATNCLFSNNAAQAYGGAANACWLRNCALVRNAAYSGGGGANLNACDSSLIISNSATGGGGLYNNIGRSYNCTIVFNSATQFGGGVAASDLENSICYFNSAPSGSNYLNCNLNYSCTTPASLITSITNAPLFQDVAHGNFRLASNSPCINAANPAAWPNLHVDLDSLPRVAGDTTDMGAYEFQSPASIISYAWLQQYGLPTDGTADFVDTDGDGMNNWLEWCCLTDPTNPLSVLKMLAPSNSVSGVNVPWQSVGGITYYLQRSTNLAAPSSFSTIKSFIHGQAGTTTFTDTNAIGPGPFFYRVGVQSSSFGP